MTVKSVSIDGKTARRTSVGGAVVGIALALLLTGCGRGSDARIRRVHELGRHPTEPNRNRLAGFAADPDRDVRANALLVLEVVDPERAAKIARTALGDPDGIVRAAAVRVVTPGVTSDAELLRTLTDLLRADAFWQVRRRALQAIAASDEPEVRAAVTDALSDPVRHVRRAALDVARERPGYLPVDAIVALAGSDPDWENRVEAAKALVASKEPAALAALALAAGDPNEFVRAEAVRGRRALERAGVTPPPAPAAPAVPQPGEAKSGSGV